MFMAYFSPRFGGKPACRVLLSTVPSGSKLRQMTARPAVGRIITGDGSAARKTVSPPSSGSSSLRYNNNVHSLWPPASPLNQSKCPLYSWPGWYRTIAGISNIFRSMLNSLDTCALIFLTGRLPAFAATDDEVLKLAAGSSGFAMTSDGISLSAFSEMMLSESSLLRKPSSTQIGGDEHTSRALGSFGSSNAPSRSQLLPRASSAAPRSCRDAGSGGRMTDGTTEGAGGMPAQG
mmetsp:Transcript_37658/g.100177  ORF Transcript_37658/g.100177 Transcript_37658/m.100177 type:complete len:234 (+) Transcript_37658:673-1374(+)